MDRYYASLANACLEMGGITHFYSDNVPDDFAVPSLYFPPFESYPSVSALNSYQTSYTLYANVFALTRQDAMEIAEKIVQGIMQKKCRLPVLNSDGSDSGTIFKLNPPEARVVEEGVAQLTLTYSIIKEFKKKTYPKMQNFGINKDYD